MQRIHFAHQYLDAVREGTKTTTVRKEAIDLPSPEVLLDFDDVQLPATVTATRLTTVGELTDADAVSDGFADRAALIAALRTHYDEVLDDDVVTVVSFTVH